MRRIATTLGAVLVLGAGLAACETATPYQPLTAGNAVYGGFSDQRLDESHYRVAFQGNDATSREQVENYLLYRAAELTVNQGYDWFEMVDRHTRDRGESYVVPNGPYYWSPYWRFHGSWGWGVWDPYWGGAWDYDVERIDRYQAVAEIAMGHGGKPSDPRALNAHEVMQNLGPHIARPK